LILHLNDSIGRYSKQVFYLRRGDGAIMRVHRPAENGKLRLAVVSNVAIIN